MLICLQTGSSGGMYYVICVFDTILEILTELFKLPNSNPYQFSKLTVDNCHG